MSSYIYDGTSIYNTKVDVDPPELPAENEWAAVDANAIKTAFETDTRNAILAGKGFGFTEQATVPVVVGMSTFIWTKTDGNLFLHRGLSNLNIPAATVSAKGDMLVYNGTSWAKLAVGSDTQVLTADSTQATGIKWSAAAGGGTLASAYNSVGTTGNTISSTAAGGAVIIADSASPAAGDLFRLTNLAGSFLLNVSKRGGVSIDPTNDNTNGYGLIINPSGGSGLAAATNHIYFRSGANVSETFTGGGVWTNMFFNQFARTVVSFSSPTTVPIATMTIFDGGPSPSTNATFTKTYAAVMLRHGLYIQDGSTPTTSELFRISNNAQTQDYVSVTQTGTTFNGARNQVIIGDDGLTVNATAAPNLSVARFTIGEPGALSGIPAASEMPFISVGNGQTHTWTGGGSWTYAYFNYFARTGMAFTTSTTVPLAVNMQLDGGPIAGTNGTITKSYNLYLTRGGQYIRDSLIPQTSELFRIGNNGETINYVSVTPNTTALGQAVSSSGTAPTLFTVAPGAHTGLTASSEVVDVNFNLARIVQRATGAVTLQRALQIQAPTYSFVGGSTISDAATVYVSGPPIAGTNATITRPYAIMLDNGGGIWMRDNATPTTNNWLLFNSNNAATTYLQLTSTQLKSTNFIWDISNSRLGIGDSSFSPLSTFHLKGSAGSTAFMRIECSAAPGATGLFGATDSPQGAFAGSLSTYPMYLRYNNTNTLELNSGSLFRPVTDTTVALGDATHRYLSLFTGQTSVGTSITTGISIENPTAASGSNQNSPTLDFIGAAWTGAASQAESVKLYLQSTYASSFARPRLAFRNFVGTSYVEGFIEATTFASQTLVLGAASSGVSTAPKPFALGSSPSGGSFNFDDSGSFIFFSAATANVPTGASATERFRIDTSNLTTTINIIPTTTNTQTVGSSAKVFNQVWGTSYGGVEQTVNAAATISPDPAAGEYIRIALGATGITTVNAPTGKPGQKMVTAIIQDASGSRTITGWAANWVFATAYTASSGINKRDILVWVWDNTASKWYEIGRTMNV